MTVASTRNRRELIADIVEMGGRVETEESGWLRAGNDWAMFDRVVAVDLSHAPITNEWLGRLSYLPGLRRLWLSGTQVTDDGLVHLSGMNRLAWLILDNTRVTDDGLRHLAGMKSLDLLDLDHTEVTGEGFRHLAALP